MGKSMRVLFFLLFLSLGFGRRRHAKRIFGKKKKDVSPVHDEERQRLVLPRILKPVESPPEEASFNDAPTHVKYRMPDDRDKRPLEAYFYWSKSLISPCPDGKEIFLGYDIWFVKLDDDGDESQVRKEQGCDDDSHTPFCTAGNLLSGTSYVVYVRRKCIDESRGGQVAYGSWSGSEVYDTDSWEFTLQRTVDSIRDGQLIDEWKKVGQTWSALKWNAESYDQRKVGTVLETITRWSALKVESEKSVTLVVLNSYRDYKAVFGVGKSEAAAIGGIACILTKHILISFVESIVKVPGGENVDSYLDAIIESATSFGSYEGHLGHSRNKVPTDIIRSFESTIFNLPEEAPNGYSADLQKFADNTRFDYSKFRNKVLEIIAHLRTLLNIKDGMTQVAIAAKVATFTTNALGNLLAPLTLGLSTVVGKAASGVAKWGAAKYAKRQQEKNVNRLMLLDQVATAILRPNINPVILIRFMALTSIVNTHENPLNAETRLRSRHRLSTLALFFGELWRDEIFREEVLYSESSEHELKFPPKRLVFEELLEAIKESNLSAYGAKISALFESIQADTLLETHENMDSAAFGGTGTFFQSDGSIGVEAIADAFSSLGE